VATLTAQAPKGWLVRADRSTSASDPDKSGTIKFVTMGTGFHATNPQAAVYWNPANTATGAYTVKGTFTLVKPSDHINYYGVVFGGSDLGGPKQSYLYFLVAQDGTENGERRRQETGRHWKVHQCPRGSRRRRQDHLRRQRHGRAHAAQDRAVGEDRRDLRHARQSRARSAHRRIRGHEIGSRFV